MYAWRPRAPQRALPSDGFASQRQYSLGYRYDDVAAELSVLSVVRVRRRRARAGPGVRRHAGVSYFVSRVVSIVVALHNLSTYFFD